MYQILTCPWWIVVFKTSLRGQRSRSLKLDCTMRSDQPGPKNIHKKARVTLGTLPAFPHLTHVDYIGRSRCLPVYSVQIQHCDQIRSALMTLGGTTNRFLNYMAFLLRTKISTINNTVLNRNLQRLISYLYTCQMWRSKHGPISPRIHVQEVFVQLAAKQRYFLAATFTNTSRGVSRVNFV